MVLYFSRGENVLKRDVDAAEMPTEGSILET